MFCTQFASSIMIWGGRTFSGGSSSIGKRGNGGGVIRGPMYTQTMWLRSVQRVGAGADRLHQVHPHLRVDARWARRRRCRSRRTSSRGRGSGARSPRCGRSRATRRGGGTPRSARPCGPRSPGTSRSSRPSTSSAWAGSRARGTRRTAAPAPSTGAAGRPSVCPGPPGTAVRSLPATTSTAPLGRLQSPHPCRSQGSGPRRRAVAPVGQVSTGMTRVATKPLLTSPVIVGVSRSAPSRNTLSLANDTWDMVRTLEL